VHTRFDHVAIAVADLGAAWQLFGEILGAEFIAGGDDGEIGIRVIQALLPPGVKLELVQPLDATSNLQKFLDERGPGFHHMTLVVDDLGRTQDALAAKGYATTPIDRRAPGWREMYIRPRSGFGTLIQLTDTPLDRWGRPVACSRDAALKQPSSKSLRRREGLKWTLLILRCASCRTLSLDTPSRRSGPT
jgi:methylmalonyl-CoA/ethylmalonyl-CoA epimerase